MGRAEGVREGAEKKSGGQASHGYTTPGARLRTGCGEGEGDEQTKGTRDVIQLHYSLAKLPFSLAQFTNGGPRRAPHPSDQGGLRAVQQHHPEVPIPGFSKTPKNKTKRPCNVTRRRRRECGEEGSRGVE